LVPITMIAYGPTTASPSRPMRVLSIPGIIPSPSGPLAPQPRTNAPPSRRRGEAVKHAGTSAVT
jgi:hypothetical protein